MMIVSLLAAAAIMPAFQAQVPARTGPAVTLSRVSHEGEKLAYDVKSHIQIEFRQRGLQTWIPEDLDLSYGFTTQVVKMKPDGIVELHYLRPTITEVRGETADSPPQQKTDKLNLDFLLTLSPINQIVASKDLGKKSAQGNSESTSEEAGAEQPTTQESVNAYVGQFVVDIYRLALNTGSFESALDFSPKLPVDEVKPGDNWKSTVGYSPQRLAGTKDKSAVQRLDYTYTYEGIVESKGKKVQRISAVLSLNTDLAPFFHQSMHVSPAETGIQSITLTLNTKIDFDLDLKTNQTLRAVSESHGGVSFATTQYPDAPLHEERINGRTVMNLVGRS